MTNYVLISNIDLKTLQIPSEYKEWLKVWLKKQDELIENGSVASSMCFQSAVSEYLIYGKMKRDWEGVFSSYLTDTSGEPLAYSENFGKQLYKFAGQWKQTPVHSVYIRYWFDKFFGNSANIQKYAALIEGFIQPDGWIYNPSVSPTQVRTRMKSELFMSLAMGLEILVSANKINKHRNAFVATLSQAPITGYVSAEFFRVLALETLNATNHLPVGLANMLNDCRAGQGYCDFSVKNKVDDYMGTAKRTSRDVALHSPLATVQALHVSNYLLPVEKELIGIEVQKFARHLHKNPFDIPAFTIRDIQTPFGTDISPVELVCATWLRQNSINYGKQKKSVEEQ